MRRSIALVIALFTTLALAPGTAHAAQSRSTGAPPDGGQHGPRHDITLVTGDRVLVSPGPPSSVTVLPGAGRDRVVFRSFAAGGRQYLIPVDVMSAIRDGRLDRRLFDLTSLIESGHTRRGSLPLLLTLRPGAPAASVATAGLVMGTTLPSVSAVAATVAIGDAAAVWKHLSTSDAVEAVWFDGLRRPTLEHSVPQIGAPSAYAAGYTGVGVRIAVLDTGVDTTHPDLAGKVAASRNFTEEADGDVVGHGTHVASTAVGSGAASGGRYRGVAHGATVLSGKVCEEFGCRESAILAGMEWAAAEQGADIVNLSLGGPDAPGDDLVEAALNRLTAEHGTLFVVSAGNSGAPGTIGSPSSADAALSVGAVDRDDLLAGFSSRGPRVDGAVKPEITAPGVDITAAQATGTGPGPYVAYSGTSMAAPHVAGAAALLAQQHPDWTADRLRAALVGSARTMPDAGVFDQGAGRVDLARAIDQDLLAGPPTVSLGRQSWPHHDDEPVRRETTITNTGADAVTLTLRMDVTAPDGSPAPAGMFTTDTTEVTVPAGGGATVGVTVDTRVPGQDGRYGGWLVGTGPGGSVTVPVGVDKEVESYDVAFDWRGFDGSATAPVYVLVIDTETFTFHEVDTSGGPTSLRLPVGDRYLLDSLFEDGNRIGHLMQPALSVSGPMSVMLDARRTRPIRMTVPDPAVERVFTGLRVDIDLGDGSGMGTLMYLPGEFDVSTAHLGPELDGLTAGLAAQWAVPSPSGGHHRSPSLYAMGHQQRHSYFTGFERNYRSRDFARVRAEHFGQRPGRLAIRGVFSTAAPIAVGLANDLPSTRTEYLTGEDTSWFGLFDEYSEETGFENFLADAEALQRRPGHAYTERWNRPMFGPRLPATGVVGRVGADIIVAFADLRGDRDGHTGFTATGTARTTLYREGVKVGESFDPGGAVFPVPPDEANFRLEMVTDSGQPLSPHTSVVWAFRSEPAAEFELRHLPVTVVRYAPPVDDAGSARGGRLALVPIGVERQSLPASDVRAVTVEVSYDDGGTWRRVPLVGPGSAASSPVTEGSADGLAGARWLALLHHPRGPGHVSLRATGADRFGNTFEQTILRAYTLR
jgi:hypothetical protein